MEYNREEKLNNFRQPLAVSRTNPFMYKERNRPPRREIMLTVLNTVFAKVAVSEFPVSAISNNHYDSGTKRYRTALRRNKFRREILYPSMKAGGVLDPLIVQYVTNVPKEVGGFICVIGNNRLRVIREFEDLNIKEVPCFVVNLVGEGGDFGKEPIKGRVIDSDEVALEYYNGRYTSRARARQNSPPTSNDPYCVRFIRNDDGYLIDIRIKRFRGEY